MSMQILRRHTGAAGAPALLKSGQLALNDVDGNIYCGIGDNGSGIATSIAVVAGAAFLLANKVNAANGVAPLDANKYVPMANLPPSIVGAMNYQGTWDPTTNTPQLVSSTGTKGFIYKVSKAAAPVTASQSSATSGQFTQIPFTSTAGITVGQLVTGTNISAGTTVTAVVANTSVTISQASSGGNASGTSYTFAPYLDGTTQFNIGDQIVFDGTVWDKIDGLSSEVLSVAGRTGAVVLSLADIAGVNALAPLASPALTGAPTAPTAAAGDNSTKLSTTAFVAAAISAALAAYATLASPQLTGTPTAPTAAAGTNNTQIATTAFVAAALSSGTSTNVDDGTF